MRRAWVRSRSTWRRAVAARRSNGGREPRSARYRETAAALTEFYHTVTHLRPLRSRRRRRRP
eukprot:4614672-Prymnesium_polylepis.1